MPTYPNPYTWIEEVEELQCWDCDVYLFSVSKGMSFREALTKAYDAGYVNGEERGENRAKSEIRKSLGL
jgi:hypothetical protein